ncbi:MAG: GNAT family N-acetyltransferase [Gaiellaceae bacterium]
MRTAEPGERLDALRPIWHYFGSPAGPDEGRAAGMLLPAERLLVATDDGEIVAGAGTFEFQLTIPGGPVPTAGVTVVGVLPTHRRRGIVRELMSAQLKDAHTCGEPIAALWASEGGFYGRFGYGMASVCADVEIPKDHAKFNGTVDWPGTTRLVTVDEASELFPQVYDRVAATTPGMISRTEEWWRKRTLADSEWRRAGGGELAFAVLEQAGEPEAYAIYRLNFSYADGVPTGATHVVEAVGATPEATAAVWRYLLDIDWMAKVEAELLPVDHPLHLLLLEQSRMRFRVGDGVWIRPVDVGAALAARAYAGDGDLVLEVSDAFCPWNDGRYGLDGSRTTAGPDLRLTVDALGCVYLGGFTFTDLLRAGRVEQVKEGASERADALFRTDRKPWCAEIF